jgi:PncC family amidohydrolase
MKDYYQLIELLRARKLTISTAESCTGGLISKLITDIPGSSDVFVGGVVSYSNAMKMKWLGVKQATLERYGAVSEQTVREMLNGIMRETGSDLAAAVSGIAGPTGGTIEKPVGTVFIGIAFHDQRIIERYNFKGSREDVRTQSAMEVLKILANLF